MTPKTEQQIIPLLDRIVEAFEFIILLVTVITVVFSIDKIARLLIYVGAK